MAKQPQPCTRLSFFNDFGRKREIDVVCWILNSNSVARSRLQNQIEMSVDARTHHMLPKKAKNQILQNSFRGIAFPRKRQEKTHKATFGQNVRKNDTLDFSQALAPMRDPTERLPLTPLGKTFRGGKGS